MFFRYFILCILFFAVGGLGACAIGPGTSEGSTGIASLSFELEELEEGESFESADGFKLTFSQWALCFKQATVGEASINQEVPAEFATEEVAEFWEIDDIAAGEYDEVTLEFCMADEILAGAVHQGTEGEATEVKELEGASFAAVGEATKEADTCTFTVRIETLREVSVSTEGVDIDIDEEEETEVLIHLNPSEIFGSIEFAGLGCSSNADLDIDGDTHAAVANEIENNFTAAAFELVSTEADGHHHH